jgi:hypothetical protein
MSKDTKHIRNRDAWKARALAYERAIRLTLLEQAHLADGDNCTLIELKRALRDNATDGTADNTAGSGYETLAAIYKRRAVEFDSCLRILQQARDTLTGAAGIPWQTIAAAVDRTPENEAAERAIGSLHAQDDVDISGRSEGVKK